ncbi:GMC oxidoreductase [Lasiosphaeria hispida]|uniref:GMC oxidoreductase n=1 Tax=Lasiosphaeria hispida TaxID=260671 RepID=A0AAJ0H827_9PEZI|nr:GMC oxidoreductase [Lasiosphaeria hispida]
MKLSLHMRCLAVATLGAAAVEGAVGRLFSSSFGIPGSDATFDYVVIGGGTAGLVVASRLVEQGAGTVAVVEAGTFYETSNGPLSEVPAYAANYVGKDPTNWQPLIDWGYVTVPQRGAENIKMHYPRGKTLGGSSGRNYMIYHRGTNGSYQMWADLVGDDSYTFENFLPYFEKSMNFTPPNPEFRLANATPEYDVRTLENTGGPLPLTFPNFVYTFSTWAVEALKQIGLPIIQGFQSGDLLGSSYSMFTINPDTMVRASSETAWLRPSLQSPNYTIYHLTLARKILFGANKTATGVRVDTMGAEYTLSARKEVILAAGVIGSPALLQLSGIGPPALLSSLSIPLVHPLPGVGQGMQDQLVFGISHRITHRTASAFQSPSLLAAQTALFLTEAAGMLTSPATDVLAFERLPRASLTNTTRAALAQFPHDWPDLEFVALASYLGNGSNPTTADPADGTNYATLCVIPVAPVSRGSVQVVSADAAVAPAIDPAFLVDAADVEVAVAGFKRAREFWRAGALQGVVLGEEVYPGAGVVSDAEIAASVRRSFQTIFHGACTCKMGRAGEEMAVVDARARVFGVQGLRVVDAAAFPVLPPGHPAATVYALAEKIACDISGAC